MTVIQKTSDGMPFFILYANDRAAPLALHAYADASSMYGKSREYTTEIHELAVLFVRWRQAQSEGAPTAAGE